MGGVGFCFGSGGVEGFVLAFDITEEQYEVG